MGRTGLRAPADAGRWPETMVTAMLVAVWAVMVGADIDAGAPAVESGEDARAREREEYEGALEGVRELIKAGKLKEAEEAVERQEAKYAGKWNVGRFGYVTRMEIGQAYLDRGKTAEALRLFAAARPGGGCGNCMASQHVDRNIRVARIQESRLNFPGAFLSYLDALPRTSLGGGFLIVVFGLVYTAAAMIAPVVAVVVFVRYRRRRAKVSSGGQPPGAGDAAEPRV